MVASSRLCSSLGRPVGRSASQDCGLPSRCSISPKASSQNNWTRRWEACCWSIPWIVGERAIRRRFRLIEPTTRGDPASPLRWTCKSVRHLATELTRPGHRTSHRVVAVLLRRRGYSLQANRKTIGGTRHPDRNAQFEHIAARVQAALRQSQPAISVDTKKKEIVGQLKNAGREWRAHGQPRPVRVHDFVLPELGRVILYAVDDLGADTGWVSVGINHDPEAFAVASIRHWW